MTSTFTMDGFVRGARLCVPLGIASIPFGIAFGVLALETGLSFAQAVGMSALVFAGASQMVALDAWTTPPAVFALAVAAAAINVRHVVMGAAIRPWLRPLPLVQSHLALLFVTDANWAYAVSAHQKGENDAAVLVGSGLLMWAGWVLGTAVGHAGGSVIGDPSAFGVDAIVPAFFALMLTPLWPGVRRAAPWLVAAVVAVASHQVLPGAWHVVAGGLAGAVVGALQRD